MLVSTVRPIRSQMLRITEQRDHSKEGVTGDDHQSSYLSICLKPSLFFGYFLGTFPVELKGPLLRRRTAGIGKWMNHFCALALVVTAIVYIGCPVMLGFRNRRKECLSARFGAVSDLLGEFAFITFVLTTLYTGNLRIGPLEDMFELCTTAERDLRVLGGFRPPTSDVKYKATVFVIHLVTLGSSIVELLPGIIQNQRTIEYYKTFLPSEWATFTVVVCCGVFGLLWTLGCMYAIAVYVPIVWLFEMFNETLARICPDGNNAALVRQELHATLARLLSRTNKHLSVLLLGFFCEEVLYGRVLQLHQVLVSPNPLTTHVVRTICVFTRLVAVSGLLTKVHFSARSPSEQVHQMLLKNPDSFELQAWQSFLSSESLGARVGFIQVTPGFLLATINTVVTFAVLLVQFQDSSSTQPFCK